ncbi:MAG: hypothetical protein LC657_14185 [Desulfobacteraceae bacterium]|nr:hypothetical protein [Desulfobacteraceae bacterium]
MALRWYGRLWRKAVDPVDGHAQLWFRADISYPGFSRDLLWGITDIAYYGGLDDRSVRFAHNRRMLHKRPFYFAEYGSANKIAASNTGTAVWCLDAWFRGASGVLPWNIIGTKKAWNRQSRPHCFIPAYQRSWISRDSPKSKKRHILENNARNRFLENFTFDTMIQKHQIVYNSI